MRLDELSGGSIKDLSSRRAFLKLTSITGLGLITSPTFLFSESAYGMCYRNYFNGSIYCDPYDWSWYYQNYQNRYYQYYQQRMQALYGQLLLAKINELSLQKPRWHVQEPTGGKIIIANDEFKPSYGVMTMTVVGEGSIDDMPEDQHQVDYTLPARSWKMYEFADGPSGQTPGNKQLGAWTRKDSKSTPMRVYG